MVHSGFSLVGGRCASALYPTKSYVSVASRVIFLTFISYINNWHASMSFVPFFFFSECQGRKIFYLQSLI